MPTRDQTLELEWQQLRRLLDDEVDFPSADSYYRCVDVAYQFRAGSADETRHAYLDNQGFNVQ
jgi:hypothetical protein